MTEPPAPPGSSRGELLRNFLRDSGGPPTPSAATRPGGTGAAPDDSLTRAADLDEIVDRVVRRIEDRVVDELERRGRRHNREAF